MKSTDKLKHHCRQYLDTFDHITFASAGLRDSEMNNSQKKNKKSISKFKVFLTGRLGFFFLERLQ